MKQARFKSTIYLGIIRGGAEVEWLLQTNYNRLFLTLQHCPSLEPISNLSTKSTYFLMQMSMKTHLLTLF